MFDKRRVKQACCLCWAGPVVRKRTELIDRRLALPWYPAAKVVFHTLAFLLIASALTSTWCMASEPTKFPAFLTSWGLMLGTATYLVQFAVTLRFRGRPPPPDSRLVQASQVLHNSNASLSCLITVFYWGVVWPSLPDEAKYSGWWDKVAGHGLITVIVITDLLAFSPIPKLRRQFVFPILFAVTWFTFSYVYYVSGGLGLKNHDPEGEGKPYLYKMVDWQNHVPRTVGLGFGVGFLLFVIHISLWLIDQFFVRRCCFREETRIPAVGDENKGDDELKGLRSVHAIAQNVVA